VHHPRTGLREAELSKPVFQGRLDYHELNSFGYTLEMDMGTGQGCQESVFVAGRTEMKVMQTLHEW
jgi:hypothetical protein